MSKLIKKPKKKRSPNYEDKLVVKGTFDKLIKTAMQDNHKESSKKK